MIAFFIRGVRSKPRRLSWLVRDAVGCQLDAWRPHHRHMLRNDLLHIDWFRFGMLMSHSGTTGREIDWMRRKPRGKVDPEQPANLLETPTMANQLVKNYQRNISATPDAVSL